MKIEDDKLAKLIEAYKNNGFSNELIKTAIINKDYPVDRIDEFDKCFKEYRKNMLNIGYTEPQIYTLAANYPKVIFTSFYGGKLSKRYRKCLESLNIEEENHDIKIAFECKTIREILELIDIPKKRIDLAYNKNYPIIFMEPKKVLKNIKFYLDCGMTKDELTYSVSRNLHILEYGSEEFKELLEKLEFFGVNKLGFIKIIKIYVRLKSRIHIDDFIKMLDAAKKKKLDYLEFGKCLTNKGDITQYNEEAFEAAYQKLLSIDFNDEQTCNIISRAISVISMSKETLEYKISILESFVGNKEKALSVISSWPTYFTLSPENIKNKLDVAFRFGILWYVLEKPINLIQGSELTEARALYLRIYYPTLNEEEYARDVYTSSDFFKNKYDVTGEEVKKLLNYKN